jgi:hypothetical protein
LFNTLANIVARRPHLSIPHDAIVQFPAGEPFVHVAPRAFDEDTRTPRHPLPTRHPTTTKFRKFPLTPILTPIMNCGSVYVGTLPPPFAGQRMEPYIVTV